MIAEIKEAAEQVRKYWAQFPPEHWVRNGISAPGEKLLALIDALPDLDAELTRRAQSEHELRDKVEHLNDLLRRALTQRGP